MNLPDFIPSHLVLIIIIVSVIAGVILLALVIFLIIQANKRNKKISECVKKILFKTKFNYELCAKESDDFHNFIKISYKCFGHYIAYYFYIPKSNNYLAVAKKEVNRLIKDNTLSNYTLKIVPKWEFNEYAY